MRPFLRQGDKIAWMLFVDVVCAAVQKIANGVFRNINRKL